MDTTKSLTFVCALWTILLYVHVDVCSGARSGGSSSKTGSIISQSNSAGFVGGPDTSSPTFIIFLTIFGMCVLAVVIFLIIMFFKIRRYWCFRFINIPGSSDKSHVLQESSDKSNVLQDSADKSNSNPVFGDSVEGSARWNNASDPPIKKPPLLPVEDLAKKLVIQSILKKEKRKPRGKSIDSMESDSLPPIFTLPYPVSTGCNNFTPPPEPELSESYSESESDSATVDEEVDSALSDRTQPDLLDYHSGNNHP
ncbi:uncharacterized protein LOC117338823 [Pecten maximus]|uniref:uncharacterized protein LOC117338823 n=1 Tax=Pecten maximus TaxID=6579 RepID=UPI001458AC6F|nr:uncharacterized protein LOC117338823 [Pecten maximus]